MKIQFLIILFANLVFGGPVRLHTNKSIYLMGEPVFLEAHSDGPQHLSLEARDAKLLIIDSKGMKKSYTPPMIYCRLSESTDRPTVSFNTLILSDGGFVFENPGSYRLVLMSNGDNSTPISDEIQLLVKAPVSGNDKKAFQIIAENPSEYALSVYLVGADHLTDGMQILKRISEFQNGYSPVAHYVNAVNMSRESINYKTGAVRHAQLANAIHSAKKVSSNLSPYAHLEMARYLKEQLQKQVNNQTPLSHELQSDIHGFVREAIAQAHSGSSHLKVELLKD